MTVSIGGTNQSNRPIKITTQQTETVVGFNSDVNTADAPEDVWPGPNNLIVTPTAAGVVACVSDSADDAAAGTGARTITLRGVGAGPTFDVILESVTLNGTTPVNTIASFAFVNRIFVTSAGSGGKNVGLLSFSIGGDLTNVLAIGKNLSSTCLEMMPAAEVPGTFPHLSSFTMFVGKQQNALVSMSIYSRVAALGEIELEAFNIPFSSNGAPIQVELTVPQFQQPGDTLGIRVLESSANSVLVAAIIQVVYLAP